jgi:hypothetical protein
MNKHLHAEKRSQQRGIPPLIIEWLEEFGEQVYDHHGAVILHFTNKSRRKLEKAVGHEVVRRLSEWLDSYAVQSLNGNLITVGHRYQRIWH